MSEKQPKYRVIDLNELEDMTKMTPEGLMDYLKKDLIPDLSSLGQTRELLRDAWKDGYDQACDEEKCGYHDENAQQDYLSKLIL